MRAGLTRVTAVADADMSKAPPPMNAGLAGFVLTDSTQQPIAGAEVSFPELGRTAMSDEKGQFRILDVPAGEQHVQVRRLGYGPADTTLRFVAGQALVRSFVLPRAVTLQAVDVNAEAVRIRSFDEHKRTGLGRFMERAEIEKFGGMNTSTMLSAMPGLDVIHVRTAAYVLSPRAPPGSGVYVASRTERAAGMPAAACYAQVYVDGVLMNGIKEPTEPYDVNQILPDDIQAIEFYAGAAETPFEYSRMGSSCGVLVVWTSLKKK
jgi:hypothetical protein